MFDEIKVPKSVVSSTKPKDRRCESCPRWATMCRDIFQISGELPKVQTCPIWNGQYDIDMKLWYHETESSVEQEHCSELELKVKNSVKQIVRDINQKTTYQKVDDCNYMVFVDYLDEEFGIIPIHVEKRKIDYLVHDDEHLFEVLTQKNLMTNFAKSYQYMKARFKKLQLRGHCNRIYFEAYDSTKLDEMIYSYVELYDKIIEGLTFKLEMSHPKSP